YKACPVGGDVPLSLYQAVAEVLAFVYRDRNATAGSAEPAGAAGGAR
ncbi:MAG: hypothetical protein HKN12_02765, partial [Gemmatimonadetes bacterium]|nr:hypothetical protein [Gemmatimonadota bacterium]